MDKKYLYIGGSIILLYLFYTYYYAAPKTVQPIISRKTDYTYDVEPTVSLKDIQSKFSKVYDTQKTFKPQSIEESVSEQDVSEEPVPTETVTDASSQYTPISEELLPEEIDEGYVKKLEELRDSIYYNMVKIENDYISKFQSQVSQKNLNELLAKLNAQKALYNAEPSVENEVSMKLSQTAYNKERTAVKNRVEQARVEYRNTNSDWKDLSKMYDATEDRIAKIYSALGKSYQSTVGIYNPFYYK
jgi:hypothetical protein